MPGALAAAIEARFPGASCAITRDGVRVELEVGGIAFAARAAMEPDAHVAIELPATDGFELALTWTDRSQSTRPPTFDDSFLVETNDVGLANAWLDHEVRRALLVTRYVAASPPTLRDTALLVHDGTWEHQLRGGEVTARRAGAEDSPERVVDMLEASLVLASRPVRWARWFADVARALGGDASARVELGGKPVLRARRGQVDVTVKLARRLSSADHGRLRTVVSAHRLGSSGEVLTLIAAHLPAAAWPPPNDPGAPTLRIDARARALLDAAQPSTTIVRPHDVEITFDGALADPPRLGAAIDLAAHWADAPGAPYR